MDVYMYDDVCVRVLVVMLFERKSDSRRLNE